GILRLSIRANRSKGRDAKPPIYRIYSYDSGVAECHLIETTVSVPPVVRACRTSHAVDTPLQGPRSSRPAQAHLEAGLVGRSEHDVRTRRRGVLRGLTNRQRFRRQRPGGPGGQLALRSRIAAGAARPDPPRIATEYRRA